MTHDELLDKIYWHWKNADDAKFFGLSGYRKALRAVVELHTGNDISNRCVACLHDNKCETIQAIEKELA